MKAVWSGFCVAFSLYSTLPVPQAPWEEKTMRWALAFLPLVGALIGGLELVWFAFCRAFGADGLFYAAFAALLPVAVSGGIHLDGLADTCDALCSFGDREKRLAILKDPHIGAFGVLWLASFLLAETACFAQLYRTPAFWPCAAAAPALARALGGRKIVAMPCAKGSGLARQFADNSDRRAVSRLLAIEGILLAALLLAGTFRRGAFAAGWTAFALLLPAVWSAAHRRLCLRDFGGITGDLAGFYISTAELLLLALAAIGGLFI